MTQHKFNPDWVVKPGDHITELLETQGKTQAWLAKKTKRPTEQVNRLIKARIRLTERWAIELAKAFPGPSAEFWARLEANYRVGLAMGKKVMK